MTFRFIFTSTVVIFGVWTVALAGPDNSKKVVGVWKLTKAEGGPYRELLEMGLSVEFEFTKDGKSITKVRDRNVGDPTTYKVKDDTIIFKRLLKDKGKKEIERETTWTITKLTETELFVIDNEEAEGRKNLEFRRGK